MSHSAHSGNDPVIAGVVLPLQRAEELIATLPGVVSVRIVATDSGSVGAIHVLTTGDTVPKQMVRNVESALMAHLGMRVDHRKVSVATTVARLSPPAGVSAAAVQQALAAASAPAAPTAAAGKVASTAAGKAASTAAGEAASTAAGEAASTAAGESAGADTTSAGTPRRTMYFEDVEIRGSRSKGVGCKVTLRRGDETYVGEADGYESDRSRMEVAARAALAALAQADGSERRVLNLEGCKLVEAFEREFVFVGVTVRLGRESALMTGSAEVKDSTETAAVLAVLDATNRWVAGRAT